MLGPLQSWGCGSTQHSSRSPAALHHLRGSERQWLQGKRHCGWRWSRGRRQRAVRGRWMQDTLIGGLNSVGKFVPYDTWRHLKMRKWILQPLEEEPSRPGGLHVQSPCCRSTLRSRSRQEALREERKAGISSQRQQQCRAGCATGPEIGPRRGLTFPHVGALERR